MNVKQRYIGAIVAIITVSSLTLLSMMKSYQDIAGNIIFTLFSLVVFGLIGYVIGKSLEPQNSVKRGSKKNHSEEAHNEL